MFIETQNLIIRDLKKKDAISIYQFVREPSTYRYMPNNADDYETLQDYLDAPYWFREPEQEDSINFRVGRYYAVTIPASDEIIGVVGRGLKEDWNEIEIAYFLSEKYRGKGYAHEAVSAFVEWCFKVSDLPYLIATISCDNLPSNKLIKKCKFEIMEKRIPIRHGQLMEDERYFYYRKYRA